MALWVLAMGCHVWLAEPNVPLCGRIKLNLKKCVVGKIKNTEDLAMSVGPVAVQLQHGLYAVGYLSKLGFYFMFKAFVVVVISSVRLACNGKMFAKGGI